MTPQNATPNDSSSAAAFQEGLADLAGLMLDNGIHTLKVEYSGANDESNGFDVSYLDAGGKTLRLDPQGLEDAAGELMDIAIELSGHDQFWDGNGGCGAFTVTVDGEARIEHSYYQTDEQAKEYAYSVSGDGPTMLPGREDLEAAGESSQYRIENTARRAEMLTLAVGLADTLKEGGYTQAYMSYSGSGDEGFTDEFRIDDLTETQTAEVIANLPEVEGEEFRDALERLMDHCVDANGYSGWENNDGGCGSITLTSEGEIAYSHTSYEEEVVGEPHVVAWSFEAPQANYQPEPTL